MLDLLQHAAFVIGVLDLLHLDHLSFLENFDGIVALVVLGLDEMYAAKAAGAQGALDGEILQCVLALCDTRLWLGDVHAAIGGLGRLLLELGLLLLVVGGRGIVGADGMY